MSLQTPLPLFLLLQSSKYCIPHNNPDNSTHSCPDKDRDQRSQKSVLPRQFPPWDHVDIDFFFRGGSERNLRDEELSYGSLICG